MSRQAEKNPQFFKIFDATKYSNQLHIPSAYASYVQGNLPNEAVFCDKFGNMWLVKLAKIESEWYFKEGWAKVAQDNSLQHNNFIIFQFDGDKIFYIQIIGNDSCDTQGVGSFKYILDSKEMKVDERKGKAGVQESKFFGESSRNFCREKSARHEQDAANVDQKQKAKIDPYGADIFKSRQLVQPINPYFIAGIRLYRRNQLHVPYCVIKDFNLILPKKIILRDPNGRTWPSNLTTWKDGRMFYNGGWDNLCRVNLIDPQDRCVCEFIQGQGEQIIQIQIVRN